MKIVILMFACIFLCGCTSMRWYHPGSFDKANLDSDKSDCRKQAKAYILNQLSDPSHPRGPKAWKFAAKLNYKIEYHECMERKGWTFAYYIGDKADKEKTKYETCNIRAMKYARDKLFEPSHLKGRGLWNYGYKINWSEAHSKCMAEESIYLTIPKK